jgi:hypothetical protein
VGALPRDRRKSEFSILLVKYVHVCTYVSSLSPNSNALEPDWPRNDHQSHVLSPSSVLPLPHYTFIAVKKKSEFVSKMLFGFYFAFFKSRIPEIA